MINIKKWFNKNKKLVFIVLAVLCASYFYRNIKEHFVISDIKTKKINNALESIIACDASGKCNANSGIIVDFMSFKKKLEYPNFDVMLFSDLIQKRKEKDEALTREEIVFLVEKGKYESSFKKGTKESFDGGESGEGGELPPELEQIDPNTDAGQCVQSLKSLQKWMENTKKANEKQYQDAITEWNKKKSKYLNELKNNPAKWISFCGQYPNTCKENIDSFFKRFSGEQKGWTKRQPQGNFSEQDCAIECIKDPINCHFYVSNNDGQCWLKGGNSNSGIHMIYKTDTGMSVRPNNQLKGSNTSDAKHTNLTISQCLQKCSGRGDCFYAESKSGNGGRGDCWLKRMTDNKHRTHTGIPNTKTRNFNLSNNHPYIQQKVGPMPKRSDFPFPTPPAIICQDCRQAVRNVNTTDSTDIDFDQVQQCIVNKAESEAEAKAEADAAKAEIAEIAERAANASAREAEEEKIEKESASNTGLIVGLSVGGLAFVVIIVLVIMLMRKGRR